MYVEAQARILLGGHSVLGFEGLSQNIFEDDDCNASTIDLNENMCTPLGLVRADTFKLPQNYVVGHPE